jgi:radical SAM superfamily enzyme YgiQ (UPF0313 family)
MAVYPTALPQLASAVVHAGHSVRQFDLLVHGPAALPIALAKSEADLIGISLRNIDNTDSMEVQSYLAGYRDLVRRVRSHTNAPIVVGGSGFSLFPRELMELLDVDYGVVGPGEQSLCALVESLDGNTDVADIPNLITHDIKHNNLHPASAVPSRVAFCGRGAHDGRIVEFYWREGGMIGLHTKRGCSRSCIYCTYPIIDGPAVVCAEVGEVVDEIERMVTQWNVRYFFVVDSIFNLDPVREQDMAEEICRRELDISWGAFFAPTEMDSDYLQVLVRSGLTHVEFGTDSLCDHVLSTLRKGFTVDDVVEASSRCRDLGIHCAHYLLFGGPEETSYTIRETMDVASKLGKCVFFPFAGVRIYPGTALFDLAVEEGSIDPEDNLLDPRFYLAQELDAERIWKIVNKNSNDRQWVLPHRMQSLKPFMRRLRQRGVKGPLWEKLVM